MTGKRTKSARDAREVCEDALVHLEFISRDWIPLLTESIASVQAGEMTNGLRILLPKMCSQLMSTLDYIGTYAQSMCPRRSRSKPYFFLVPPDATDQDIEKKMQKVFPGLDDAYLPLYEFMKRAQRLLREVPSVFQELRGLNAMMKHHRLLPKQRIAPHPGVTLVNWSAQPNRPPMWVWTRRIEMSAESSFAGGPGSLLVAADTIVCDNESMIFGFAGEDIRAGKTAPKVEALDFALVWYVPGVTKPLLQFFGEAVNHTARLVRQFVEMNGLWNQLWPKHRIAHFGQIFSSGTMTLNPGRVEADWKEDGKAPNVSLITWGKDADPIRD